MSDAQDVASGGGIASSDTSDTNPGGWGTGGGWGDASGTNPGGWGPAPDTPPGGWGARFVTVNGAGRSHSPTPSPTADTPVMDAMPHPDSPQVLYDLYHSLLLRTYLDQRKKQYARGMRENALFAKRITTLDKRIRRIQSAMAPSHSSRLI